MSNPYEASLAKLKKVPPKEKPCDEGTDNALTTSTYLAKLRKLRPTEKPFEEETKNPSTSFSRKALPKEKPDQNYKEQTEIALPPHSTYEKIGVLDVSVYTSCEYPVKEEKNKSPTKVTPTRTLKRGWRSKFKIALFAAIAALLAITLMTSFALGVAGVVKTAKCRNDEMSVLLNGTSETYTGSLLLTTGVSI